MAARQSDPVSEKQSQQTLLPAAHPISVGNSNRDGSDLIHKSGSDPQNVTVVTFEGSPSKLTPHITSFLTPQIGSFYRPQIDGKIGLSQGASNGPPTLLFRGPLIGTNLRSLPSLPIPPAFSGGTPQQISTPPKTPQILKVSEKPRLTVDLSMPRAIDPSISAPDLVRGKYKDDFDILKIHEAIRALFGSQLGKLKEMKDEVEAKEKILSSGFVSHIETLKLSERVTFLKKTIDEIESGCLWEEYVSKAGPILNAYIPFASDAVKRIVTFGGKDDTTEESSETVEQRLALIEDYLAVARNYIKIDIVREVNIISKCPNCQMDFDDILLDEETGLHTCICGYERANLSKIGSYKDSSRVNIGGRSSYEDKTTFIKAMDKFEGKKIGKIPPKLYAMLDTYFESKGFPIGDEVKKWPLTSRGKKAHTSVELMASALAGTNNAAFYDIIQYIAHIYWGWILPDLSSIREGILEDYDVTQQVYEEIKERESSLNVQIRMFYHYRARGYECELTDFKILSSRDSLEYHHRMLKIMSERTGVKFTPII